MPSHGISSHLVGLVWPVAFAGIYAVMGVVLLAQGRRVLGMVNLVTGGFCGLRLPVIVWLKRRQAAAGVGPNEKVAQLYSGKVVASSCRRAVRRGLGHLTIANMDFDEFADATDGSGRFHGFEQE